MKKKIIILAVIGVFSILFINTNISLNAEESNNISTRSGIVDPNLQTCVDNEITREGVSDISEITYLDCSNQNITSIEGLDSATSLTNLFLTDNQISDISSLSGLTNLQYLHLSNNQISDISSLSGLTNIQYLYLADNQISNISPLSGMTNMYTLVLSSNQIVDISPLSGMRNIDILSLDVNQISDISSLSSLVTITSLDLGQNQISDISLLSRLTNIHTLDLADNQISNISPLSGMTNIHWLALANNQISDMSPLESLLPTNGGTLNNLLARNQEIYLPDITVSTADEIFTTVTDANNIEYTISLGIPTNGTSTLSATFNYDGVLGLSTDIFNGTIYQNVTYGSSTGSGGGGSTGSGGGGSSHNSKYPPNIILSKHEITLLKDSAEPRWKNYIVKVLDDDDNLTANDVVVTEDVDMSEVGEYTVHYKVTDSDNLSDEDDLIVTIVETEEELPVEDTDEEVVEDIDNTNDNEIEKDEIIKNDDVEEEQLTNTANTNMITIILIGILGLLSFIIIERKVK